MALVTAGTRMRAIVARGSSAPAELRLEEMDLPVVPDGGVLVRVRASSVNPVDLYALTPVARMQRGFKPAVVGTDFAGVVESVGSGVTSIQPGDTVFGGARGAFADYLCVSAEKAVVLKPAGVSFEDAASLVVAGSTALQAVRDHGRVAKGQRVLINGASGGVGTFLVQIARTFGADVTAVCSTRNVGIVREIGADRVIDYTKQDFVQIGDRYDVLLDVAGNRSWSEFTRVLRPGGTYVAVGAAGVQHGKGGGWRAIGHYLQVRVVSTGSGFRVVTFIAKLRKDDLTFLGDLVASGRVKPVIDRTYDLDHIADALVYLNEGHAMGKVAITVGP